MPDLFPALLPRHAHTLDVEPPGSCPVCLSKVPQVLSEVTLRTGQAETKPGCIVLPVSLAALTVTAQPCGHVIHEMRDGGDM